MKPMNLRGVAAVSLMALLLTACAKNIDTEDAVKQSVLKDIAGKVDVSAMDINVDSVSFRDKEANAEISFRAKGQPTSQAITMKYDLVRQGDEWKIKGRDMQQHQQAAAAGAGAGQGTAGQGTGNGQQLPAGHPATNGQTQLPPGHPSVQNSGK
jgi:hypothetical protein